MIKLLKRFSLKDWILLVFIIAFTVLQVYCTMTMVDYVQGIIKAINYLDYHNNPMKLGTQIYLMLSSIGGDVYQIGVESFWNNILANPLINNSQLASIKTIAEASTSQIWFNGGMIVLVSFSSTLVQIIISVMASFISADFATKVRNDLNKKISNFSLSEINKFSSASLVTRATNDIQQVQMTIVISLRMLFAAPITAIWAIFKIQASSLELTIATIIALVILLVFIILVILFVIPKFKVVQKLVDRLNKITQESLLGIRVVRAFNAQDYQINKEEKTNFELNKLQLFTGRIMGLFTPIMMIVMNGISLAIYYIGATLINKGEIDFATITSFIMLATQIIMAFMMLMMMFILLPRGQVSAKRINEVLDTKLSIVDPIDEKTPTCKGQLEFKNVSFKYPEAPENILDNISFKINKGETIAFIGSTGSGKSTLVNLIARLYDVSKGEILIDGVNVKDLKQTTLRSLIGFVPQKGVLFSGTIASNLSFGKENATKEEIDEALDVAQASEFVNNFDDKENHIIAQGGTNVSGGQRQRLCIARAYIKKPEFLVFDDSFSALDYKTDLKVRENLKEKAKDATKVIVAQRIGTIMDADKIVVLNNGKMVGIGKHKELLKTCEVYKEIALSQLSKEELGLCQE